MRIIQNNIGIPTKGQWPFTPEELLVHIMYDYYALNIETIVAKKYKHNKKYYDDFIENKNQIKQQLLAKPELHFLWSAS